MPITPEHSPSPIFTEATRGLKIERRAVALRVIKKTNFTVIGEGGQTLASAQKEGVAP